MCEIVEKLLLLLKKQFFYGTLYINIIKFHAISALKSE